MRTKLRSKISLLFMTFTVLLAIPAIALASEVSTFSVVDAEAPTGSVTLTPGNHGTFTINMAVTGKQDGTATFKVYRDWTLSGGSFSKTASTETDYVAPETFSVPARSAGDPATTFSTTGKVRVASGQAAGGPFTLAFGAEEITNSNATGAKLSAGTLSNYQITVSSPPADPCASVTNPATPVISANPDVPNGDNDWYKTIPTVSATSSTSGATITYATEVNGGAKSSYSSTAPVLGQGQTIVYAKATSATCDRVSESSREFHVDSIAPDVNPASVVNNVWRNSSLSQPFTASDSGSGLADPADESFTLTASAESADANTPTVVSKQVFDVAGNSTTRSVSAKIDLTNPSVSAQLDKTAASTGWFNIATGAPTVSFLCSDALSGLAGSCPPDYTFGEGADQSKSSGTIYDNAGNSNSAGVQNVDVDLSKPNNIAFVGGPAAGSSYDFGDNIPGAPTCTADDVVSGLKSCVVSGYSTAVGNHTLTATATDNAGNTATATRSYTVLAWTLSGFYSPVDMGDVVNTVKNGSTVPLKFEVFKASGPELTDTAIVKQPLTAKQVSCTAFNGDPVDEIELLATGATSLRYDSTGGQFIYNWQTPKGASQVGKCFTVSVGTQDGSSIPIASFKLK